MLSERSSLDEALFNDGSALSAVFLSDLSEKVVVQLDKGPSGCAKRNTIQSKGQGLPSVVQAQLRQRAVAVLTSDIFDKIRAVKVRNRPMRPAIRVAAMSGYPSIFVFTHDSIGLGEDGPTHQPVEQTASLRTIPNLIVIRPADANETAAAWKFALEYKDGPVALLLTRQGLPVLDPDKYASPVNLSKGAYVLLGVDKPDVLLLATGSEVSIAVDAVEKLKSDGINAQVVNMPCWELFEKQGRIP